MLKQFYVAVGTSQAKLVRISAVAGVRAALHSLPRSCAGLLHTAATLLQPTLSELIAFLASSSPRGCFGAAILCGYDHRP